MPFQRPVKRLTKHFILQGLFAEQPLQLPDLVP
jgi:hypothetical protein